MAHPLSGPWRAGDAIIFDSRKVFNSVSLVIWNFKTKILITAQHSRITNKKPLSNYLKLLPRSALLFNTLNAIYERLSLSEHFNLKATPFLKVCH